MADLTGMLQAAAGAAGGENLYIEDVFSCFLYTGNGSSQTITNGIDLDGEGGLVWIKNRDQTDSHILTDTERGATEILVSNTTAAEATDADTLTAFNSTGFAIGADDKVNTNTENFVSWSFRKAPKFFDVVTYTGNGVAGRQISHNLGSVPGCVIIKWTSAAVDWAVYHRSLGFSTGGPPYNGLILNGTSATGTYDPPISDASSTTITLTTSGSNTNSNGATYVAYLFAHDAGGFGDDGSENVITCGSYTGTGAAGNAITLGYEPQWIMLKRRSGTGSWAIFDNMRGITTGGNDLRVQADQTDADLDTQNILAATATGFQLEADSAWNTDGSTYIYIAIRRGPMKTPTAGTEVFSPVAYTGTGSTANMTTGFVADMAISEKRSDPAGYTWDRLRGNFKYLMTYANFTEGTESASVSWDTNNGLNFGSSGYVNQSSINYVHWVFKRAPGFFDVVCYTGTGSATTFNHNLGVVPELMIVRKRSAEDNWAVYFGDNTDFMLLDTDAATSDNNTYWNDTSPTATVFSVGTNSDVNTSAATYVAYLFATLAGISKVGTYTGTGTTLAIDCGFSAGARFVMIKRVDSTGSWFVWDSARGIVSGDDPYIRLDLDSAEVTNTDYVDTSSAGFEITSTAPAAINASGGTFIFLAIA